MQRAGFALVVSLAVVGCSDSGDTVTSASTGSEGSTHGSSSADASTSTSTATTPTTGTDTTCASDCASTGTETTTNVADSSGSSSSSGSGSSSESSSTESSSSEGPIAVCGDGVVEGAEDCDDSGESATCNENCTAASCGDAIHNASAGEACDAGGESFSCDVDCTAPVCGDGIANSSADEVCDDGGSSVACDDDCTLPSCGDAVVNPAAIETCDDGNDDDGDGCSAACLIEGDLGGLCRIVDDRQWCFDDDNCGQACDDVCGALGLTIEPDDTAWFAAQDTAGECQAISDAFGMVAPIQLDGASLGCLEDGGLDDTVGGGLTGGLQCSTDPLCPAAHRTAMDDQDGICNLPGARRSVCPCEGSFCGNGLIEPGEECDDGNHIQNDGCTSSCSPIPPSCVDVAGVLWCQNPGVCGETCDEVCGGLGLAIDISDEDWFAAQDTMAECQAIADGLGIPIVNIGSYMYACAENDGADEGPGLPNAGTLYCTTFAMCPQAHRTGVDAPDLACGIANTFQSICPCN